MTKHRVVLRKFDEHIWQIGDTNYYIIRSNVYDGKSERSRLRAYEIGRRDAGGFILGEHPDGGIFNTLREAKEFFLTNYADQLTDNKDIAR